MKRKPVAGLARGAARGLRAAAVRVLGYPSAAAGALLAAACGDDVPVAVSGEPPVRMEPIPTSTAAAVGAQLQVGDPCPLHEEGRVLEEVPESVEATAPVKKRRAIRPRRDPIRTAGVPMAVHHLGADPGF